MKEERLEGMGQVDEQEVEWWVQDMHSGDHINYLTDPLGGMHRFSQIVEEKSSSKDLQEASNRSMMRFKPSEADLGPEDRQEDRLGKQEIDQLRTKSKGLYLLAKNLEKNRQDFNHGHKRIAYLQKRIQVWTIWMEEQQHKGKQQLKALRGLISSAPYRRQKFRQCQQALSLKELMAGAIKKGVSKKNICELFFNQFTKADVLRVYREEKDSHRRQIQAQRQQNRQNRIGIHQGEEGEVERAADEPIVPIGSHEQEDQEEIMENEEAGEQQQLQQATEGVDKLSLS